MSTDISNAYNSDYIQRSSIFLKCGNKERVKVFVENESDKVFWWSILEPYQTIYNVEFDISDFVIDNKTQNGKSSILSKIEDSQLGRNLIVCLDSDLDELIDNFSCYSERIRRNKYIVTTYWYSMENVKCHPRNLRNLVTKLSLKINFPEDIDKYLEEISNELKEVYLYNLIFKEHHIGGFKLEDFSDILGAIQFDSVGLNIQKLHQKIGRWKLSHLILLDTYRSELISMENKLFDSGFSSDCYWQIINGHFYQTNIVVPLLKFLVEKYRSEHLRQIYRRDDSAKEKEKMKLEYFFQTGTNIKGESIQKIIERELRLISTIPQCSALERIKSQIDNIYHGI